MIVPLVLLTAMSAATYVGSPAAKKAAKSGRVAVRELAIDLDGDGAKEIAVVEKRAGKMRVALFRSTGKVEDEHGGFAPIMATADRPGRRVIRLEPMRLVGRAAPELIAVVEEPSPDESALTVVVLGGDSGPPRELFAQTFFIPKDAKKKDNVVEFGDASPHYVVEDLDGEENGDKEIVWTRGPQTLAIHDAEGQPIEFVIGAFRTIYRYEPNKGVYLVAQERDRVDFLEAIPPHEVEASAQVKKVWGTAQAFWGTDQNLTTAWGVDRKGAVGQSLSVKFKGSPDISVIRVVPGCALSGATWNEYDRIRTFKVELGSGVRFEIDRDRLTELPSAIRAAAEFPLGEGFGSQVLIFLKRTQAVPWARFEIVKLDKSRPRGTKQVRVACLSEISFH